MEKTTVYTYETRNTRAAVYGLAVVGFLALVFIGIMLAIYASRYVPEALTKLASSSSTPAGTVTVRFFGIALISA